MKIDFRYFVQKKIILSLAIVFVSVLYKGQRHEIGVQLGMSNLVGDIGKTNYILQKPVLSNMRDYGMPFYGSVLYRMNFNPYQTVRINLGYIHIQFIDAVAKELYRQNRKLWGTNSIVELDALFEYNFFPVNDEQKGMASPYVFGGIGALLANTPQAILEADFRRVGGAAQTPVDNTDFLMTPTYTSTKKIAMAVPFGVGIKYKFNYNWSLFGEVMFRPTFSDTIDYSVIDKSDVKVTYNKDILMPGTTKSLLQDEQFKPEVERRTEEFLKNRQIGNINSKDWLNSISIGLSYSFGRPPCYCD